MPTIIVISVMLPAFKYLENPRFNLITVLGALVSILGIVCESIADIEMHLFRKQNKNHTINNGLWKYSRHPNYFGEILMWWGVFIYSLSGNISFLYIIGPLALTALFYFVSIPLMERRLLEKKTDYLKYQRSTSKLILFPPKKH
jgi:steroid 5-alpha reductase family enzyme